MAPWLLHRVVFHAVHLVLVVYGVVAQWLARLSWPTLKTARTLDTHRLTRLRKAMVKPPPHVSVALTDPFELEDVARCVVGLALAGVRHISVWDHQGDALSHSIGLYEAVCKCQRQHGGSSSALFRGGLACPQVRPLPEGRVHSGTTLRIYGPEHGRSDVVNAVRSLAEGAVDPAALSRMTPEAFSRHLAYSSPEPDLLLKFGECDSLYGYPPWQLRVTEIISMPCVAHVSTEAIVACLAKYAATERRFGK